MAMKDIGVYNIGQPLAADEAQDAVDILNVLQNELNSDGLFINFVTRENFTLTPGLGVYTWGITTPASTFATARPIKIVNAFIRDGDTDYPVDVSTGMQGYEDLPVKDNTGRPDKLWHNPTYPAATLYLYFVPDTNYQIFFDTEKDLIDFTSLYADISMPPEYMAAFRWNLGIDLCPSYKKTPTPFMMKRADDSLRAVRRLNLANKMNKTRLAIFTVPQTASQGTILSYD